MAICFFCIAAFGSASAQTGQTLNFDGVDDYVSLPLAFSGSYTKEAWINPTTASLTGFPNIFTGSNATGTALFLNAGRLAAGHATSFNQVVDPAPLVAGTWYHVAVTYDSVTGIMNLYKDGALVGTNTAPSYTETFLNIGSFGTGFYFQGDVDEVRLWGYARSQAEIQASQNCELTGDEPFLLAYYNFNQGIAGGTNTTETTLLDRQDKCTPLNGTLNNFALTGNTSNWVAPGPTLSGTCSNSFANISLNGNGNCIATGDSIPSIIDFTDFGSFGSVPLRRTFTIQNTGNATLNIGTVTITGTNAGDFSFVTPVSTIAPGGSATLDVTFNPTGALGVKNAVITINNSDTDEAAFTFAVSGTSYPAGQTLNFDGVNDYVALPVIVSGSYTKEAYIYTNTLTGYPNILTGNNVTGTALFLDNGRLAAGHGADGFTNIVDPTVLTPGTWYHVAVTYDAASGIMNLYKNGVLVGSAPASAYTETFLNIGNFANANFFEGNIDEVRIWSVARTAAEIAANVNCPLSGSEAGLIAYYNFNEGAAGGDNPTVTQLIDLHGDCPQNGQLQNFALTGPTSNWIAPGAPLPGTCTAQVPNINVAGNNNCILTGDVTPSTTDNTDYGTLNAGETVNHTFYIRNNGGADLSVSSVAVVGAADFTVAPFTPVILVPGDSVAVVVTYAPTASGTSTATVTVGNTDADEAAYTFTVTGAAVSPLPVTLVSFRANAAGKVVSLSWETSLELNNAGFELQRSTDNNVSWQKIGYVAATNRANGSKYNFIDAAPVKGTNAYRLKQIDLNGRSSISRVELVNFSGDVNSISLYPNPVQDKVSIVTNDSKLLNTQAKISTASGATIRTIMITNLRQEVNLGNLAKGIYFIRFNNGTVQRIVKL
jgi:hypothetical protein